MKTISFKVTAREAALIRELARREGVTVSEFIRRRTTELAPLAEPQEYRITSDPLTGLPVMVAPPGAPRVTSEQIRALLIDFP